MTPEERARIGRAWVEMALGEHASVASFARLVLHLMALGAPSDLVTEAIRSMADEVNHARTCFGLAKRVTGISTGPGRLDISSVVERECSPSAIVEAAIREGCFGETIAARCARAAAGLVADDALREVLMGIADDESRHAEFSWRLVEWIVEAYPEVRAAAAECFSACLEMPHDFGDADESIVLEMFGHPRASVRMQIAEDTLRDFIRPRAETLLRGITERAM